MVIFDGFNIEPEKKVFPGDVIEDFFGTGISLEMDVEQEFHVFDVIIILEKCLLLPVPLALIGYGENLNR